MTMNPYSPPKFHEADELKPDRMSLIGLRLASVAFIAFLLSVPLRDIPLLGLLVRCAMFLCLPGLLFSLLGYFSRQDSKAGWGIVLGLIVAIYLPALIFAASQ